MNTMKESLRKAQKVRRAGVIAAFPEPSPQVSQTAVDSPNSPFSEGEE